MRATAMCWAMALAMALPIEAEQAPPLAVTAVGGWRLWQHIFTSNGANR